MRNEEQQFYDDWKFFDIFVNQDIIARILCTKGKSIQQQKKAGAQFHVFIDMFCIVLENMLFLFRTHGDLFPGVCPDVL